GRQRRIPAAIGAAAGGRRADADAPGKGREAPRRMVKVGRQKAGGRRQKVFAWLLLLSAFCLLPLRANEISVDKRTIQMDDAITITVTLENEFANVRSIRIPLHNLAFSCAPSVSSEFQWINGVTSRRKLFTYTAHATAAGNAVVGPITLHGTAGQVETLAP